MVSPDWLAEHLDDPSIVLLEVAFATPDNAMYFTEGHIPGAHFAYWKDLCWHDSDRQFATAQEMASRLEAFGVSDDTTLVLVGDTIQFATYTFWVLTMTGHDHLARVLDGGHKAWALEGRPMTREVPATPERGSVTPRTGDSSSRLGRDDMLAHLGDPNRVLVDMRSDEEYHGERVSPSHFPVDYGAERKGRIPGARHLYYERLLDTDGRFLPAGEIGRRLDAIGADPDADVVTYCRLSHRATLGWFAATHLLGRSNVRVYDGSWTEWGSIVGFPIER